MRHAIATETIQGNDCACVPLQRGARAMRRRRRTILRGVLLALGDADC